MTAIDQAARDRLAAYVSRIERLEAERAAIGADIREVYAEAKGAGFDTRALRRVVALRRLGEDERREQEAILETYCAALGIAWERTPLAAAAIAAAAGVDAVEA